ncbi:MAG: hypothetical protein WKF58_07065 [Ilumatobacteraceae bacterium]
MVGPLEAYQPSIHVDDAATAVVVALGVSSGYYNVADQPITKGAWNAAFFDAFGIDKKPRSIPKLALKAGARRSVSSPAAAGSRRSAS